MLIVLVCGLWTTTTPVYASFHLWEIREVYSNGDGSVQFIELFTTFNGQEFTLGQSITTNTSSPFVFPSNTPSPTANHRLLLATAGFESLLGGVTPDFIIPANFFDPASDFINLVGAATSASVSNMPTDGLNSVFFPGGASGTNSPTNYAGDVGKLVALGDMNEDSVVDVDDVGSFIQALVDRTAFEAAHPTVDADLVGDINEDGNFDLGDVKDFSSLISNLSSANSNAIPEPSTFALLACSLLGLACCRRR